VATQDTVTLIRSAIRSLLKGADEALASELRACLKRNDDYSSPGKPACDWEDAQAREALIDALARDAYAILAALDGRTLPAPVSQAAQLVATVVGQDLERREDGLFRIARRVVKDRVISTVDPDARHGHKTSARGFDGYKGHVAVDPDSEMITATTVTAANAGDGSVAAELAKDVLSVPAVQPTAESATGVMETKDAVAQSEAVSPVEIYGDAAYGTAEFVERIEATGAEANVKVQPPPAAEGKFAKDEFCIDLDAKTVRCPANVLVVIQPRADGGGVATFGAHCAGCALRERCTDSKHGRSIQLHPREATLQRARQAQRHPGWKARYRATRPKVERMLSHLMRQRHGGRRARVRGCKRVACDFALLGAAVNLKRLATLGVRRQGSQWVR